MQVFIALGSNLGNRAENISRAIQLIEERVGRVTSLSALYETSPDGFESDNIFLNGALCLETELSAFEILYLSKQIEHELGRAKKYSPSYTDRPIDLDLIFYGNQVIDTDELTIPHKLMHQRRFVLEPLNDIAPDFEHPVLCRTVSDLLRQIL